MKRFTVHPTRIIAAVLTATLLLTLGAGIAEARKKGQKKKGRGTHNQGGTHFNRSGTIVQSFNAGSGTLLVRENGQPMMYRVDQFTKITYGGMVRLGESIPTTSLRSGQRVNITRGLSADKVSRIDILGDHNYRNSSQSGNRRWSR